MLDSVALSGAVGVMAHIHGRHLHVAWSGDCCAVLGSKTPNDTWVAKVLSAPAHTAENSGEVRRVLEEHPREDMHNVSFKLILKETFKIL